MVCIECRMKVKPYRRAPVENRLVLSIKYSSVFLEDKQPIQLIKSTAHDPTPGMRRRLHIHRGVWQRQAVPELVQHRADRGRRQSPHLAAAPVVKDPLPVHGSAVQKHAEHVAPGAGPHAHRGSAKERQRSRAESGVGSGALGDVVPPGEVHHCDVDSVGRRRDLDMLDDFDPQGDPAVFVAERDGFRDGEGWDSNNGRRGRCDVPLPRLSFVLKALRPVLHHAPSNQLRGSTLDHQTGGTQSLQGIVRHLLWRIAALE
mmetsp:Transcript_15605/g.39958  ORF Transcript_15605/g.39958 Transcript_15605/m.39958 type:complete len:259 (+) Transcript_15605:1997-2773(+)